ncbi:MAG: PmoA family protein [Planctomycetaceae bacterium]|nr:PmoA family protein [Planctomycetaceae bacterium]
MINNLQRCFRSAIAVLLLAYVPIAMAADDISKKLAFSVEEQADRLRIALGGVPVADFVFRDPDVRRPCFASVRTVGGIAVTRTHPPVEGVDAVDHPTMHPGIWLGFGSLGGEDFWRNKGTIEHVKFVTPPRVEGNRLTFAIESKLLASDGRTLGMMQNQFRLSAQDHNWRIDWEATFRDHQEPLAFGDQEEMGFGVRLATPLIEKNGGAITNSTGLVTAARTWGQVAEWCDYSGTSEDRPVGITVVAGPDNFRESWWHNRDYGLMVANPFGRAAMKQGLASTVTVKPGESLRLRFVAIVHDGSDYDPAKAVADILADRKRAR